MMSAYILKSNKNTKNKAVRMSYKIARIRSIYGDL